MHFIFQLFVLFRSVPFVLAASSHGLPYDLSSPIQVHILPDTLREVSGLAVIDSVSFACIQDENGIIFIYNSANRSIEHQFRFASDGDYEGIAIAGKNYYVLRSDGIIFETPVNRKKPNTRSYMTTISARNNEGLCYDALNNRLLVACKSKPAKGAAFKDQREIYAVDLKTKVTSPEPVFVFSVQRAVDFIIGKGISLPIRKKGKNTVPFLKFSASEIAIHPFTREIYMLLAGDGILLVFDQKGEFADARKLDKNIFNKPEGISFLANGDMLVTNEGQNHHASLLKFAYKPDK
jgi:uncharacterized protein YjiK